MHTSQELTAQLQVVEQGISFQVIGQSLLDDKGLQVFVRGGVQVQRKSELVRQVMGSRTRSGGLSAVCLQ